LIVVGSQELDCWWGALPCWRTYGPDRRLAIQVVPPHEHGTYSSASLLTGANLRCGMPPACRASTGSEWAALVSLYAR